MTDLQLVVPMTGVGQRFVDAGFLELKPLIKIAGETIISHVMKMYPSIADPVFIISNNHPQRELLKMELKTLRPDAKIIEIDPHKLGPSYAVWQVREQLDLSRPTIINYCDFGGIWDLSKMEAALEKNDGAILTYTGFHPHMLRNTEYAYVKTDENGHVTEIQEKKSFTDDPFSEEASAGTYGFATGDLLIRAIAKQIHRGISLKNEFYTSLTYKPLIEEGRKIVCVEMDKFFQWGTPEDLRDWIYWRDAVNEMTNYRPAVDEVLGSTVILAAGRGSRLAVIGSTPKPLVPVGKFLLWEYSGLCATQNKESVVVTRENLVPVENRLDVQTMIILAKGNGLHWAFLSPLSLVYVHLLDFGLTIVNFVATVMRERLGFIEILLLQLLILPWNVNSLTGLTALFALNAFLLASKSYANFSFFFMALLTYWMMQYFSHEFLIRWISLSRLSLMEIFLLLMIWGLRNVRSQENRKN